MERTRELPNNIQRAIASQRIKVTVDIKPSPYGSTVATINVAGKQLFIEVSAYGTTKAQIENTENPHSPGETTAAYIVARAFLEEEASRRGIPIEYELETGFASMKMWALTTGKTIFRWDNTHYTIDDPQKLIAHATIAPSKN